MKYVERWIQPCLQSLIIAPGLVELVDLVLKYGQNGRGRVACLELSGERMSREILLSLPFIFLEGFCKYDVEIGYGCRRSGWPRGRSGSGWRLTHDAEKMGT
jgi:hypothetical protein